MIRSEKALLVQMLTSHAYRERLATRRFRQAVRIAPSNQHRAYVQEVAREENSHYLGCLKVAKDLRIDLLTLVDRRMLRRPTAIPTFKTWLDVLLAHAFNDKAGYFVLTGIVGSKIKEYARLATDIIAEEEAHGSQGAQMLLDYYSGARLKDSHKRSLLILHLDAAVWCLGRPNSPRDKDALEFGLKTQSSAETLALFCSYADKLLTQMQCVDLLPISKRYIT
jgi:1,2-phenylacetyl-CoA epoxidase catalytic subunit